MTDNLEEGLGGGPQSLYPTSIRMAPQVKRLSKTSAGNMRSREARLAYILVLPALLVVLFIILFPAIWNIILSFQPVRLRNLPNLNLFDFSRLSLKNYATAYGPRFFYGLRVTLIFTVGSTVLAIILGLWSAILAKEEFWGRQLFRAAVLLPYIAPVVASAFIWRMLFDKNFGLINAVGAGMGMKPVPWLTARSYDINLFGLEIGLPLALIMVIFFEAWHYFPFAYLFLLARIQAIPNELYEAGKVDGATPIQRFRHITLPLLSPVIATLFLLRFIWTFYKFEDIFLLNGGGGGTEVLAIQIYNWLFARRNIGVAAAIGVTLAVSLFLFSGFYQRWVSKQEA